MNKDSMYWIIGIAVAIVVVILGWWLFTKKPVAGQGNTPTATTTTNGGQKGGTTTQSGAVTTPAAGEALSVVDQAAGDSVTIASMTLTKPSWIAVQDKRGWILGAGWFPAGATSGSVPLLRATLAGETYTALVYVDDGDKTFDFKKDAIVSGVSGSFSAK